MTDETSLSTATSRGALVNVAFAIAVQGLAAVQMVVIPRLIGPENIGLFALAMGGVAIGASLKELGIPRKLVQERDVDLHTSYSVAFTLELLLASAFLLVVLAVAPVLAILYDRTELWLLTSVLGMSIFTVAFLELPAALPHREMRFARHNVLKAIGPVVTFCVAVPAAFAGWGVWSLAAGTLAGFVVAALVLVFQGSVRPRLRWDRPLVRKYLSFGWPIWVSQMLTVAAGWGSVFVISTTIGVAGLGYFQLAQTFSQRALQVDHLVSQAIFPALCSVQSSTARLWRAFVIATRVSMLWAAPVGFGMVVFAEPVVDLFLGAEWEPAILLIRAHGAAVVISSIAFNWDLFYAARGHTKPQLVVSGLGIAWLALVAMPLLVVWEIEGVSVAVMVLAIGAFVLREHYLRRLFGRFRLFSIVWREVLVGGIAALAVAGMRQAGWRPDSIVALLLQAMAFLLVCGVAALVLSRSVIAEVWWAVRAGSRTRAAAVDAGDEGEDSERVGGPGLIVPTPRKQAFPLGVAADPVDPVIWATTRDHPSLGRIPLDGGEPTWTELPPFPHVPTPDGRGGCWAALTRSSAVAHLTRDGEVTLVPVPDSTELLVTVLAAGALWAVDAGNRTIVRVDAADHAVESLDLPEGMVRPDFVADHAGTLFVADTHSTLMAAVDPRRRIVTPLTGPHPTRFVVPDAGRAGLWLGASDRPVLSLVDERASPQLEVRLPDIPFGIGVLGDALVVALKESGRVVLVDPGSPEEPTITVIGSRPGSAPMDVAITPDGRCFVSLGLTSVVAEVPVSQGAGPQAVSTTST